MLFFLIFFLTNCFPFKFHLSATKLNRGFVVFYLWNIILDVNRNSCIIPSVITLVLQSKEAELEKRSSQRFLTFSFLLFVFSPNCKEGAEDSPCRTAFECTPNFLHVCNKTDSFTCCCLFLIQSGSKLCIHIGIHLIGFTVQGL